MPWSMPSPFVFDGPVGPDALIGRTDEADALRAWARAGRSTIVVAPRRFGKTSLLTRVQADAERLDRMPVILVDLYELASTSDLVMRLERAWARHVPARLRTRLAKVFAGTELGLNIMGNGFQVRLADRPRTDPLPALHALLDLPDRLHGKGERTLVVFDEFQSIIAVEGAEGLIRTYVQAQRDTASYVFCGSQPAMMARLFGDQARPFYGQAQRFELQRLDVGLLVSTTVDVFENTGVPGLDSVIADLMACAEGHPQRSMLLAHLLWQRVQPGPQQMDDERAHELVTQVLDDAMAAVGAEVVAMLDGLPTGEKKTLRAIAEYGTPISSRALRDLNLPKSSAQSAANALAARTVVERIPEGPDDAPRWRIIDPLMTRWVRARYPTRPVPGPR